MRVLLTISGLAFVIVLSGCARYPTTGENTAPPRTLYSEITLRGPINPAYYYYFAVDTDGDAGDGPVPIVSGSQGNGWGTISGIGPNDPIQQPPFFVQFSNDAIQQYRNGQPIGSPYRYGLSQDRTQLWVEIDVRDMVDDGVTVPSTIELNWITMKNLVIPPQDTGYVKEYDSLNESIDVTRPRFLADVPLYQSWIRYSGDDYGTPREMPEDTTTTPDIDMIGWRVETRLR